MIGNQMHGFISDGDPISCSDEPTVCEYDAATGQIKVAENNVPSIKNTEEVILKHETEHVNEIKEKKKNWLKKFKETPTKKRKPKEDNKSCKLAKEIKKQKKAQKETEQSKISKYFQSAGKSKKQESLEKSEGSTSFKAEFEFEDKNNLNTMKEGSEFKLQFPSEFEMVKKEPLECEYMVDQYKDIPSSDLPECTDSQTDTDNWESSSEQGTKRNLRQGNPPVAP